MRLMLFLILWLFSTPAPAIELTAQQEMGKQLYRSGALSSGRKPAMRLGAEGALSSASLAPCANCHGDDGHGRSDGEILTPDITWRSLSSPAAPPNSSGRQRVAFNEEDLISSVALGRDPTGAILDMAMPRYDFSREESQALVAYLKVIEADQAAGVTAEAIRVGLALPPGEPRLRESVMVIIGGLADRVNATGGIYNRKIEIEPFDAVERDEEADAFGAPLAQRNIFALLDVSAAVSLRKMTARTGTPVIAAAPQFEYEADASPRSFFLFSGPDANAQALLDHVSSLVDGAPVVTAIVYPNTPAFEAAPRLMANEAKRRHWPAPIVERYDAARFDASAIARKLTGVRSVVFFGTSEQLSSTMGAAKAQGAEPYFVAPVIAMRNDLFTLPPELLSRLLLAFPVSSADASPEALADFSQLRKKSVAANGYRAVQLFAYCATQLLIHALKTAGRDLSVSRFVGALESVRDFKTGLTRPLSFGPDRHIGAPGAYIVAIAGPERRLTPVTAWREVLNFQ